MRAQIAEVSLPPNSPEAEMGVLGCCLLDSQCVMQAREAGIRAASFYDLKNRELWERLVEMESKGDPIDSVSVAMSLRLDGRLKATDSDYLGKCIDQAPVESNLEYHTGIVCAMLQLRQIASASSKATVASKEPGANPATIIRDLEQGIDEAKDNKRGSVVTSKEVVNSWIDKLQTRQAQRKAGKFIMGIASGFWALDAKSSGFLPGTLTIIGSRPSVGKTAMICNILKHASMTNGVPTTMFSLETMHETVMNRMAADACSIDGTKLRDGEELSGDEGRRLVLFANAASKMPVRWSKEMSDIDAICGLIERDADAGVKLFALDYLQIVDTRDTGQRKNYSVGSVATALKRAAINKGVAVIALAQLKKLDDESSMPTTNDLADSDQIFRDADLIWLLHRPDRVQTPEDGMVIVAKNKEGEVGVVKMKYTPGFLRWEENRDKPQ